MLNNINLNALNEAITNIKDDEQKGIVNYGVELNWEDGVSIDARALEINLGGNPIYRDLGSWKIDEPKELLGTGENPTPQEYLMSGVGACILVGFVVHSSIKNIKLNKLSLKIYGSLNLSGFLNIKKEAPIEMLGLKYEILVDAQNASDEILEEIKDKAFSFSPNAISINKGISIEGIVKRV